MSDETGVEESRTKFLTPTYSAVLNQSISAVVAKLNEGEILGAWFSIKTLHAIIPPTVKKEVAEDYNNILQQLDTARRMRHSSDPLIEHQNVSLAFAEIMRRYSLPLFERIVESLHKHNYLEKNAKQVPIGSE